VKLSGQGAAEDLTALAAPPMLDFREVCVVVDRVRYKDWRFDVSPGPAGRPVLRLMWMGVDAYTAEPALQQSRPWLLEATNESELLRSVWLAVSTAEEHEARELFMFRGRRIFNPHSILPGCDR
jgi:hypothetical protein